MLELLLKSEEVNELEENDLMYNINRFIFTPTVIKYNLKIFFKWRKGPMKTKVPRAHKSHHAILLC